MKTARTPDITGTPVMHLHESTSYIAHLSVGLFGPFSTHELVMVNVNLRARCTHGAYACGHSVQMMSSR